MSSSAAPTPGFQSAYSAQRVDTLIKAIENGHTREAASAAAGISSRTLRRWIVERPELRERVEIAEGNAEAKYVGLLNKAAMGGDVKAIMFWLERRRPYSYGRVDRVDMIVRLEQANQARERLKSMGIDNVSIEELMTEYDQETQKTVRALPARGQTSQAQ
jgi:response regulator of citrate/malate metabolism